MTTISRLGIQGIRSYGPDEEQVLAGEEWRGWAATARALWVCARACVREY